MTHDVPTKNANPTVLPFHQPGDWPHLRSAAFRDAILLLLSPPPQNQQQSSLAQRWAHRTIPWQQDCSLQYSSSTTVDWPHFPSAAFRDAILLFHSPPSQNQQQSSLAHSWDHRTHTVTTKTAPHSNYLSSALRLATFAFCSLPWCNHLIPLPSLWEVGLMRCQQKLLPHSTSLKAAMRLATSAFHDLPWCSPLIPLSPLSEEAGICMGTALKP